MKLRSTFSSSGMKAEPRRAQVGRITGVLAAFLFGLAGVAHSASETVPAAAAIVVKDATGTTLRLAEPPRRIVTLMPSLGELAADVLESAQERIVGVSDFTDYPPALGKLPSVGSYDRFNLETVAALKPDLVLATTDGNPKDRVLRLRELGIPVLTVSTSNFEQVRQSIRLVSRALGYPDRGTRMVEQLDRGVERIRERAARRSSEPGAKKPKVLLQVGGEPLVTVGGGTFLNEALATVGAGNLYASLPEAYPRPAMEDVLNRDPDVILVMALGPEERIYRRMAEDWKQFKSMTAVKTSRVSVLKADALLRPSLRLLEGLALLERAVFPDEAAAQSRSGQQGKGRQ